MGNLFVQINLEEILRKSEIGCGSHESFWISKKGGKIDQSLYESSKYNKKKESDEITEK